MKFTVSDCEQCETRRALRIVGTLCSSVSANHCAFYVPFAHSIHSSSIHSLRRGISRLYFECATIQKETKWNRRERNSKRNEKREKKCIEKLLQRKICPLNCPFCQCHGLGVGTIFETNETYLRIFLIPEALVPEQKLLSYMLMSTSRIIEVKINCTILLIFTEYFYRILTEKQAWVLQRVKTKSAHSRLLHSAQINSATEFRIHRGQIVNKTMNRCGGCNRWAWCHKHGKQKSSIHLCAFQM